MTNLLQEAGSTEAPEPKSYYVSAKTLKPGEGVVLEVAAATMRVSDFPRKRKDGTSFTPSYLEVVGEVLESSAEHFEVGDQAVLPCSPVDLEALITNANPEPGDVVAVLLKSLEGLKQHWGGVVRKAAAKPAATTETAVVPEIGVTLAPPPVSEVTQVESADEPPPLEDGDAPPGDWGAAS